MLPDDVRPSTPDASEPAAAGAGPAAFLARPLSRGPYLGAMLGLGFLEGLARSLVALFALDGAPARALLQPFWWLRSGAPLAALPAGALVVVVLLVLPLLAVAAAVSVRRARDAGVSAWVGMGVVVPVVGVAVFFALCLLPPTRAARRPRVDGVIETLGFGFVAAVGLWVLVALAAEHGLYGSTLFVSAPFLFGVLAGWTSSALGGTSARLAAGVAVGGFLLGLGFLLLTAIEGLVCLVMVLPLTLPIVLVGAGIGWRLAQVGERPGRSSVAVVLLLPLGGLLQHQVEPPAPRQVTTRVVVDAPPEVVWEHVLRFSELPAPTGFLYATGIAVPLRARLEGEGVGAIRHCEFTTGAFVEPITVWDPPHRLGFDVVAQPRPMQEWSFYARVEPPHLERSFRSTRGEFRLTALPGGRTLLEGSTWYTLDLGPVAYWQLWADQIVHRIHARVLRHVAAISEAELRTR